MIGYLTEQEILRRIAARAAQLGRPGIVGAATWNPDDGTVDIGNEATLDDFAEAVAIFDQVVAEGERRFKTPAEFYGEFVQYPPEAIAALQRWRDVIALREWAMHRPELFAEAMGQALLEMQYAAPAVYAQLEAAGQLAFDPTTVEPLPNG
ncbi:MAG TPA: hypothetical protein VGE52_13060 [Pirellulales bacterium]